MLVTPAEPRHLAQDLGDTLQFTLPAPRSWTHFVFAIVWIVFGIPGIGLFTFATIFEFRPERILFLIMWVVGTIWVAANLLWTIGGKEIITVSAQAITYRRQVLGVSFPKQYAIDHIKHLRVLPTVSYPIAYSWGRQHNDSPDFWDGLLAFDYGAKTIRMASGIYEAEGKQMLATIQRRFPQYRQHPTASPQ